MAPTHTVVSVYMGIVSLGLMSGVLGLKDGTIRLAGTLATATQGRAEIHVNGVWGTVCDDYFGVEEANVICRQLGFNDPAQFVPKVFASMGQGTGIIMLDDLGCVGNEKNLLECPSLGAGNSNCGHSEDAGVVCAAVGDDGCLNSPPCAVPASSCIYGVTEIVSVPGKRCPICRCASCPTVPKCPSLCKSGKTEYYRGVFCRRCRCVPQVLPDQIVEPNAISVGLMAAIVVVALGVPLVCLVVVLVYKRKQAKVLAQRKKGKKDNSKQAGGQQDWFGDVSAQPKMIDIN